MIKTWKSKQTEAVFEKRHSKVIPPHLASAAQRKLFVLDSAISLQDLKTPPNNRLEKLKGNRTGQYSIRINDQYRVCFEWTNGHVENVEIVDYH